MAEDSAKLLERLGDDAQLWAEEFCKYFGNETITETLMLSWFASAIESSHDIRERARRQRRA